MQGSSLPSLLQSKLTAPRILMLHKVATYCQTKLAEQNYHMQLGAVYWDPDKQQVHSSKVTTYHMCKHLCQPVFLTGAHTEQDCK